MKKLFSIPIFLSLFCTVVLAQNNQNSPCPTIDIFGPAGLPQAGDTITFTANVEGTELANLDYDWTITTGEIVEGQGTPVIKVRLPQKWVENFTATVKVKGFPTGCSDTDSEWVGCGLPLPEAVKIDEFSLSETRIDKARLDYLISRLQENPDAQAFIVERFKRNIPQKIIKQKIQKTIDYLVRIRKQDPNRIVFVTDPSEENSTQFWIIPAGAQFPI